MELLPGTAFSASFVALVRELEIGFSAFVTCCFDGSEVVPFGHIDRA
jgi:hypothetical protein